MKELNNLSGAVGSIPSDREIFERYGQEIEMLKGVHGEILNQYIRGLIEMAMNDSYTDKEIENVVDEVNELFYHESPENVLVWEWTHTYEE